MPKNRFKLVLPSLLAAWPCVSGFAQASAAPDQSPAAPSISLAQANNPASPLAPPAAPAAPSAPATIAPPAASAPSVAPAATAPPAPSAAPADATPAPLDANQPAPIQPPAPVIDGTPKTPGVPAVAPADAGAATTGNAPRAREFNGDEVGQVLRLLARQAKINLVVSGTVQGTVNMRLEDVTALNAIEIICQSQGLFLNNVNGVYYVKTLAEKAAEPTQADFYTFSYARAAQVTALLNSQLVSKVPPQVDERTNTIFFQETKSNIDHVRAFLRQVDRPTRQVMIEARLVEVTNNPRQSYGINWGGVVGSSASPKTFQYGGGSSFPPAPTQIQGVNVINPGTVNQSTVPAFTGNPAIPQLVNTGAPLSLTQDFVNGVPALNDLVRNGFGSSVGAFGSSFANQYAILSVPQVSATLRLLNEDADAEFLANPRIVTADNLEATIKIIRNQPVPQLNFNEQTATAVFGGFQDKVFGNTLIVKPSINKDDFITLSVKPEISNHVGDQTFNFAGANVSSPIIDTRSLEANVLIKSGCTLAIGGLLQDESSKSTTKVPVLGDIPILGYLFQEHLNTRTKRNLLIFVTPTILHSEYGTGLEDQITGLKNSNSRTTYADINGWRNNAKGAIRLRKTPEKQLASQYPVPGNPDCKAVSGVRPGFKDAAPANGD